jgi:formylglycine-generating enzyme required for sulfatase activity/serine/threonine protein kinase
MGVVYQARHIFLKTSHAIKVILPDLVGNDPMLVTRFRQEALAAAAIRHQNIIAVTDFGVVRGTMPFLVMEFVKGISLHDILAKERSLSPVRALEILSAVGGGVGAAHRQNIVHRDLKPLNIMLQEEVPIAEGLKILDFGLAKIKSGELLGSFVQAKTSGLMGSPFYMAPEQWSDEEPDARADIYSLGVILYQMLGGEVPFKGTSIPAIMKKHLTELPPPLASLGMQVAPQIEAVVRHALEKDPAHRPQSAEALVNEFRAAVAASVGFAGGAYTPGPIAPQTIPLPAEGYGGTRALPRPIETVLRVRSNPPQSRVFVNNVSVGVTDNTGELIVPDIQQGAHRVRVMHDGYAEWESQIDCNGGECRVEAQLTDTSGANLFQRTDPFAGTIANVSGALAGTSSAEPVRASPEQTGRVVTPGQITQPPLATHGGATQGVPRGIQTMREEGFAQVHAQGTMAGQVAEGGVAAPAGAASRKSYSLMLMIAAILGLLVVVGGGVGGYYFLKPGPAKQVEEKPKETVEPPATMSRGEMAAIPAGTFQMGRNNGPPQEAPAHSVTVRAFMMDKTEVTNAEYGDFVRETKYVAPSHWVANKPLTGQEQWPVVNVSQEDAKAFAAWRSKRDNVTYRLPTEEEWEYAARGGDQDTLFPWGNNWEENRAVVKEASARAVGSYPAGKTRWGVFDMIGNAWEWTSSNASLYPGNKEFVIPANSRESVVIRGGSYASDPNDKLKPISATFRDWIPPTTKNLVLGFRLVRPAG